MLSSNDQSGRGNGVGTEAAPRPIQDKASVLEAGKMKKVFIGLKVFVCLLVVAVVFGLLVWASFFFDIQLGPPLYEHHAGKYLNEHGFNPDIVSAVLDGKSLDHASFLALTQVPNVSVRHMLGRNAHLTLSERQVLLRDKNEFVRQGIALNPSLSPVEIEQMMSDSSHFVWGALAMNPTVPSDVLLELYYRRHVSLNEFAKNPKCPEAIVREIEGSNNALAKQILDIVRAQQAASK